MKKNCVAFGYHFWYSIPFHFLKMHCERWKKIIVLSHYTRIICAGGLDDMEIKSGFSALPI
jgi:hypothetical protein